MRRFAKIEWIFLALLAGVNGALSWLYGKRTPQVLRAKLRAVQARETALTLELKMVEGEVLRQNGSLEGRRFAQRADKISQKLRVAREARTKVLGQTDDLEKTIDPAPTAQHSKR
jgi:hypothetical protein